MNQVQEFCAALLEYRRAQKILSTYVKPYEDITKAGDGRVHPTYSVTRTKTGRSASSNTNVQNLDRQFKDFFGAPPGKKLIEFDYSSVEFRLAAWVAQEETILARYSEDPNWDAHRFFAAIFYNKDEKDVTKQERQVAKSANFGLVFMGNGMTLVEYAKGMGLELPLHVCEKIYRTWHKVFPGFQRLYSEVEQEIYKTGESRTATGFVRHFGDVSLMPPHLRRGAIREGVNVKIQGLAAHIAFLASERITELDLPAVGFVHDAFLFEVDEDTNFEDFSLLVEEAMIAHPIRRLKELFNVDLTVPITIEGKVT